MPNQLHLVLQDLEMQQLENLDLALLENQPRWAVGTLLYERLVEEFQFQHHASRCKQSLDFLAYEQELL